MIKETSLNIKGFQYASIHSGIKKKKKDLSIIYCPKGATCAGTFTTNKTKAAPVSFSEKNIQSPLIKAIVINSGNANACTGIKGYDDACFTAKKTAELLGISDQEVLLSSTGIIGVPMPMQCIESGLPKVVTALHPHHIDAVAEGILTTDTSTKVFSTQITLTTGQTLSLCGIAKGSGMIHPNMATMLGYVMTDAVIEKSVLNQLTKSVVDDTFNMVTVDGDTSTNDMFVVMASGEANNPPIHLNTADYTLFKDALHGLSKALAISIAKDGEGASKLLQVKLFGAASAQDARVLAKSVVSSSLVKAAFFGNDANWGRIICALGYSGATFNPDELHLELKSCNGSITLMEEGTGLIFDAEHALKVLQAAVIDIHISLKSGLYSAEAWGCDLTYDYVKINGAYRT